MWRLSFWYWILRNRDDNGKDLNSGSIVDIDSKHKTGRIIRDEERERTEERTPAVEGTNKIRDGYHWRRPRIVDTQTPETDWSTTKAATHWQVR